MAVLEQQCPQNILAAAAVLLNYMFSAAKKQKKFRLSLDREIAHFPHQMQQWLPRLCDSDHKHFLSSSCSFELQQILCRSALEEAQIALARGRSERRGFPRKTWWNSTIVLIIHVFPRCTITQRGKFHYQILGHDNFCVLIFSLSRFLFVCFNFFFLPSKQLETHIYLM